jgi:hypothetical protein
LACWDATPTLTPIAALTLGAGTNSTSLNALIAAQLGGIPSTRLGHGAGPANEGNVGRIAASLAVNETPTYECRISEAAGSG